MTVHYYAGWATSDSTAAWTFDISGAYTASAVAIPDTSYSHVTMESVTGTGTYTAFATAFQTALNSGGRSGFTVSFSTSTLLYTIARVGANFGITFNSTDMRRACGFTGNLSGAASYVSTVIPYYTIAAEIGARSRVTQVYEPEEIVVEAVADGGTSYSVSKSTTETLSDWTQPMEPKAAVFIDSAEAATPWTYEHYFKHLRGMHPFICYDSNLPSTTVHKLRADGAAFTLRTRTPIAEDWDNLWFVNLMTRRLGSL